MAHIRLKGPAGLMFHHFHGGRHPRAQGSITADQLEVLLDAVGPERILPASEWLDRSVSGTLPPDALCLTFDDNLRCQYDIAGPVLRRRGMTGFWNINSAPLVGIIDRLEIYRYFRVNAFPSVDAFYDAFFRILEDGPLAEKLNTGLKGFVSAAYLSRHAIYSDMDRTFRYVRDEVLSAAEYNGVMDSMLADAGLDEEGLVDLLWMRADHLHALVDEGHLIGLHTHTHPTRLDLSNEKVQRQEYGTNFAILSDLVGSPPRTMSHPNGNYTSAVLDLLRELGTVIGFKAVPDQGGGLLEQPRYDHAELMRMLEMR